MQWDYSVSISNWERGTEELNSMGSDSRPLINSFLHCMPHLQRALEGIEG